MHTKLFDLNPLSFIMFFLVSFITLITCRFARTYLNGDSKIHHFFCSLTLLVVSMTCLVFSDHLVLFLISWMSSNFFLVKLMVHKKSWKAAKASGDLALKNFLAGAIFLSIAFFLLYNATNQTSIQALTSTLYNDKTTILALVFILLAAMTQSAIWPFNKWLLSSLNSPTPVSAMMHAGLINGGGFLLARFAPLIMQFPMILNGILIIGLISALIGTLFKLIQTDVKRMLASSTMGQMGFMLVQCGLGLFSAAIAHLCWHGLFKAYLFFSTGNSAQVQKHTLITPPSVFALILAFMCGFSSTLTFSLIIDSQLFALNSLLVIKLITFIAGTQATLTLLGKSPLKFFPTALLFSILIGGIYGVNVHFIETFLKPMHLMQPQTLNLLHSMAIALIILTWGSMLFYGNILQKENPPRWLLLLYMKTLNASQPHPSTITAQRNHYKYI